MESNLPTPMTARVELLIYWRVIDHEHQMSFPQTPKDRDLLEQPSTAWKSSWWFMSRLAIRTSIHLLERLRHAWVWRSMTEHVGYCRICHGYPNLWTFCWKWQLNNGFWMSLDVLPQLSDKPVRSHQPEQTTATNISSVQFCGWRTVSLCYKKKKVSGARIGSRESLQEKTKHSAVSRWLMNM